MTKSMQPISGANWIGGEWVAGEGSEWQRSSPGNNRPVWHGQRASVAQVQQAIKAASDAFPEWAETKLDDRIEICKRYASILQDKKEEFSRWIAFEIGKPLWEARTEVDASIAKIPNSIDAIFKRRWTTTEQIGELMAVTRFRPHGVMLVIGPFNLPSHVPGGHIIPALLAGNTVIFKPSEWASAVGQWMTEAWEAAGIPPGVLNLVHGGGEEASVATSSPRVDGVLFTGSAQVGRAIHEQFGGQPHKVLALELGGNNPLVVHNCSDLHAAAVTIILSAFLTSGQRCTCTRRLIVSGRQTYARLIDVLSELIPQIQVGLPLDEDQPFMGPLIHSKAASRLHETQHQLIQAGALARVLVERDPRSPALLRPGLIEIPEELELADEEHFGPLLMAHCTDDLDEAIQKASDTAFGLSAGFIGNDVHDFHYFLHRVRAGVVNWNRQTTGASGRLPFGGVGMSGNHNPSGFFAADYCSYPVASLESHELNEASKPVPGLPFTTQS